MSWWEKFFDEYYTEVYTSLEALTTKEVDRIIEILGLKPGKSILDLCCGYGRHSLELASRGYKVTGYDLSPYFLERARKLAQKLKIELKFIQGDMREINFQSEFDAVINMFTSFGFFPKEEEDLEVLKGVNKSLKARGLFLLDTANREYVLKNLQGRGWVPKKDFLMLEDSVFDPFTSRLENKRTLIFESQPRRDYFFSLRLYTLTEIIFRLKKTGFVVERVYGDFDLNEYSTNSPRMIILAQKKSQN